MRLEYKVSSGIQKGGYNVTCMDEIFPRTPLSTTIFAFNDHHSNVIFTEFWQSEKCHFSRKKKTYDLIRNNAGYAAPRLRISYFIRFNSGPRILNSGELP